MDDNGNATPNDAGDGALAYTRRLLPASGGQAPVIVQTSAVVLGSAMSGLRAQAGPTLALSAQVECGDGKLAYVWAAIYPPS